MLGDVRRFGLTDQHFGLFLTHLAAADHVMDEIACTLDSEGADSGRCADHFAHRASHLATCLETDFVCTLGHFGRRVTRICGAVPRASARSRSSWGRVALDHRVVVSLRLIGHGSNALLPPNMGVAANRNRMAA